MNRDKLGLGEVIVHGEFYRQESLWPLLAHVLRGYLVLRVSDNIFADRVTLTVWGKTLPAAGAGVMPLYDLVGSARDGGITVVWRSAPPEGARRMVEPPAFSFGERPDGRARAAASLVVAWEDDR